MESFAHVHCGSLITRIVLVSCHLQINSRLFFSLMFFFTQPVTEFEFLRRKKKKHQLQSIPSIPPSPSPVEPRWEQKHANSQVKWLTSVTQTAAAGALEVILIELINKEKAKGGVV